MDVAIIILRAIASICCLCCLGYMISSSIDKKREEKFEKRFGTIRSPSDDARYSKEEDIIINLKTGEVVKPNHYKRHGLPECRELIDNVLNGYSGFLSEKEIFWLGNVIKYIYRAPLKNKREDLEKAAEYLSWIKENKNGQ